MSENEDGDDDWFERALDDDADSVEDRDETAAATGESDDGEETDAVVSDQEGTFSDGVPDAGDGDEPTTSGPSDSQSDDGGVFEDDFESAFGATDTESGGADFGEAFGGGDVEGGADTEDFASAFSGGEDDEFEDEEFESDIPRIDLGIEGLDAMIQGGIPENHLMTVIGSAGTGKTTFGLQFLYHGLLVGEKGVFITLEQSREDILATAKDWGWDFDEYEANGMLAVVDLDPVEMANSLDNIRGELPELIRDFGAERLVLDSVSLLEMMYEDQARRRTEVFDFTRSLKNAGVTTFLTSEASESSPYASRHGIIEYLTDAVFILQYVRGASQEARLAVEIQKIRNTNHSRERKPYEITPDGLFVYQQANIF